MPLPKETESAVRMKHIRSASRVNSRVPITVEWSQDGQNHSVDGNTLDISPKGCLAVVPQEFTVGQTLRLTNRINGQVSEAVLIWRGHEGRTGWELGLELENPPAEFWGMDF